MTMPQMSDSLNFYASIPPITSIVESTNLAYYHDVPADWLVALTDVMGSTAAIADGRYKDVNAIAVASITAMLNQAGNVDIPFIFGGDGATMLIPPQIIDKAWHALLATQKLAAQSFNLNLRIGIVPVSEILKAGYGLKVAKLHVSDNFQQALFAGGGLPYAESLIKDPVKGPQYTLDVPGEYQADFSGFECRWNKVPSKFGETLSLIVSATPAPNVVRSAVYREVLEQIEAIYGDAETRHPISIRNLRLAFFPGAFRTEATVRYGDTSLRRRLRMAIMTNAARLWMALNVGGWGEYKKLFIAATDHEKFDDTLRMTISGSAQQREKLVRYLEGQWAAGKLFYGVHTSQFALVTCIVFDYFGRQVHFVDGADGGYTLAAKAMKAQFDRTRPELPVVRPVTQPRRFPSFNR